MCYSFETCLVFFPLPAFTEMAQFTLASAKMSHLATHTTVRKKWPDYWGNNYHYKWEKVPCQRLAIKYVPMETGMPVVPGFFRSWQQKGNGFKDQGPKE